MREALKLIEKIVSGMSTKLEKLLQMKSHLSDTKLPEKFLGFMLHPTTLNSIFCPFKTAKIENPAGKEYRRDLNNSLLKVPNINYKRVLTYYLWDPLFRQDLFGFITSITNSFGLA